MAGREESDQPRSSKFATNAKRRDMKLRNPADQADNSNLKNTQSPIAGPSSCRFSPADHYANRAAECNTADEAASSATFSEPRAMSSAVRLIDDTDGMEFLDFCREYLMDANRGFTVVGAVGGQSTGKSTILSMLAENEPGDMYRQYVFRPLYREGVASSRYQTTKIYVYINRWHTIFLDCQPVASPSLFGDFRSSHRRLNKERATDEFELMSLQILTLMTRVCDTLLLCIDHFINMTIVGDLLRTELFREKAPDLPERKINLVVLHQRAKPADLEPLVVLERQRTLAGIFVDSAFDIAGGVHLASLGFARYRSLSERSAVSYVPFGDLPPPRFGRGTDRASKNFNDSLSGEVCYRRVVHALRTQLLALPRHNGDVTEIEWFNNASKMWDRIKKELKVGFNDSLWRCKYPLEMKPRKRREWRDEEANAAGASDDDENSSQDGVEKSERRQHAAAGILPTPGRSVSGGRNARFFQRNGPCRTTPRRARNFCLDERDGETSGRPPVADYMDPHVVRIITKRSHDSEQKIMASSGEEEKNDDDATTDDGESPTGISPSTDSVSPDEEILATNLNTERKSEKQLICYRSSSRLKSAGRRRDGTYIFRSERNIDLNEYKAIKKKIFLSVDENTTANAEEERLQSKRVLKRSTTSDSDDEKREMASLHDAFCSQILSDA